MKPNPDTPALYLSIDDIATNGLVEKEEVIQAFETPEGGEKFLTELQHAHRYAKAIKKDQNLTKEDIKTLRLFNRKVGDILNYAAQSKKFEEKVEILEGKEFKYLILPDDKSAVLFGEMIGRGGFKEVAFGVDLVTGKRFAVLRSQFKGIKNYEEVAKKEEEIFKLLSGCRGIAQCYKAYYGDDCQILLMPYYNSGELEKKLPSLNEKQRAKVAHDIILGLYTLHEKRIMHSDLKPDNILLTEESPENFSAFITDFGLSYRIGEGGNSGTPNYMSPERVFALITRGAIPFPIASEVFELANMLYAILLGKPTTFT